MVTGITAHCQQRIKGLSPAVTIDHRTQLNITQPGLGTSPRTLLLGKKKWVYNKGVGGVTLSSLRMAANTLELIEADDLGYPEWAEAWGGGTTGLRCGNSSHY